MLYTNDGEWVDQEDWDRWEEAGFNVHAGESPDESMDDDPWVMTMDEQVADLVELFGEFDVDSLPSDRAFERLTEGYDEEVLEAATVELGW